MGQKKSEFYKQLCERIIIDSFTATYEGQYNYLNKIPSIFIHETWNSTPAGIGAM